VAPLPVPPRHNTHSFRHFFSPPQASPPPRPPCIILWDSLHWQEEVRAALLGALAAPLLELAPPPQRAAWFAARLPSLARHAKAGAQEGAAVAAAAERGALCTKWAAYRCDDAGAFRVKRVTFDFWGFLVSFEGMSCLHRAAGTGVKL
jgi:hypothetical protein